MTVAELESKLSHRELVEWALILKIEGERQQEAAADADLHARHMARIRRGR